MLAIVILIGVLIAGFLTAYGTGWLYKIINRLPPMHRWFEVSYGIIYW
jgi:fructose-specific phosphotransferase system IIC component